MCGAHNIHGTEEMYGKSLLEILKARDHFEDTVVDGRVILKCILSIV